MSYTATTDSYTQGTVNQSLKNVLITLYGSWYLVGGEYYDGLFYSFFWSIDNGSVYTHGPIDSGGTIYGIEDVSGANSGSFNYVVGQAYGSYITDTKIACDKNCAFYSEVAFYGGTGEGKDKFGSILSFKSYAIDATASAPASSAITASTATINCDFFPNTDVSTATVRLEYRIFGSGSSWTTAGSSGSYTGYLTQNISRSLTGLVGSTTYEYRLTMTRDTANSTTLTSSSSTFTTSASAPAIVTGTATNIGSTSAILGGTVTPGTISTYVTFEYGLTTAYGTVVGRQGPSGVGTDPINFSGYPTGLIASTLYHFRAFATYPDTTEANRVNGDDATFTTSADPTAEALAQEKIMKFDYDAVYGVQKAFTFFVVSPAATSSDRVLSAAVPWVAGDILISIDGGASANVTNLPTRIGSTPEYTITLTAAELTGENIHVRLIDANGPVWRDALIHIRTKIEVGQFKMVATAIGSNTPGFTSTGVGTSPGILAAGGSTAEFDITGVFDTLVIRHSIAQAGAASTITLDSGASATDDYYNGAIITLLAGTGTRQSRIITDYVGATKVATVNRSWATNPAVSTRFLITPGPDVWNQSAGVELASLPSATSNYGPLLQFLFQRFGYKRTQTVTTQTLFKADSSTSLATGTVADDGSTQTSGKLS